MQGACGRANMQEMHVARGKKQSRCENCGKMCQGGKCDKCGSLTKAFNKREIDLGLLMQQAAAGLGVRIPDLVKGVKGIINKKKSRSP